MTKRKITNNTYHKTHHIQHIRLDTIHVHIQQHPHTMPESMKPGEVAELDDTQSFIFPDFRLLWHRRWDIFGSISSE